MPGVSASPGHPGRDARLLSFRLAQRAARIQKPRESRSLSISINCSLEHAYDFLCYPENFSKWASGLAGSLRKVNGQWVAETPAGFMKIRFSERNAYGVLDHWVYPQPNVQIYVPMRVVSNGSGCELILTLFRQPEMTDEKFAADAEWVMRDLAAAKKLLEGLVATRVGRRA
jgi:hypothetical protein